MSLTDLYLRAKAKLRATDLWLHQAGADTGTLPPISDSGTVTISLVPSGAEALTDQGNVTLVLGVETLVEPAERWLMDLESRWEEFAEDVWPPDSDAAWESDADIRWPLDPESQPAIVLSADRWEPDADTRWAEDEDNKWPETGDGRWPPESDNHWD